ncbi:hypothetical protein [Lunatibacter salilacus]|uniref:hypothetical protein n=1 Tax=Lunatibacter salilacus TaxID=2483804 RepID=UPI00131C03B0|nr:hypothetical protein [Lunatibacter salilacus]
MKKLYILPAKKGNLLIFSLSLLLLMVRCAPEELDLIPPYDQMIDDFDEVGDLPGLDDPDPDIDDPDYEPIDTPAVLGNLLQEIIAFSDDGKPISEASKKQLEDFNNKLKEKGLDPDIFSLIDMDFLTNLMNPENAIDPQLEAILNDMFEHPDLEMPLPEVPEYGELTTIEDILARIESSKNGTGQEGLRRMDSDLYTICADRAYSAFQDRLAELTHQLREQEDAINANYLRRAYEAEERLVERNVLVHMLLMEQLVEHQEMINRILNAARLAVLAGDTELQENLLTFALIYATYIRRQMAGWYLSSLAYNYVFFEIEIQSITKLRDDRIAAVKQHYDEAVMLAEEILEKAIQVYCHNQGSGG